jgi:S1-C subfamily serine protease
MTALLTLSLLCGADTEASLGPVADAIMRPLVRVSTTYSSGSGVLLYSEDREGAGEYRTFVITNHHVVGSAIHVVKKWDSLKAEWRSFEANDRVRVEVFRYLRGGRTVLGQPIPAVIVAHNAEEDLALLELDYPLQALHCATLLPESTDLKLTQEVCAVGCSLGCDPCASFGRVTDLEELIDNRTYIMASAPIIYGNSGGGIFTCVGGAWYFCGIPSRISVTRQGQAITHLAYFIPPDRLRRWLKIQRLTFLLDNTLTPTECFAERQRLQQKGKK